MQYSQTLLDDIRAAVDIVDLVSRFVNLRKAGSHWKGLCPFHAEKTPSFTVNPQKGIFHCFGCGVGGDAFGFVMRQDRLSFPEAVRALAKSAGIERTCASFASASSAELTSPLFIRCSSLMNSPSASAVLSLTTPPAATKGPASRCVS